MTPPAASHKKIPHEHWRIYWEKATEFYVTMIDAVQKRNWNAAGLAGVHACISSADALLVKYTGMRSSAKDHLQTADLLKSHINDDHAVKQTNRLAQILAEKNLIEYVDKSYTEKEALALKINVERFVDWVKKLLR
ncbi:MAG: hypothetical protein HY401_01375 [Elusimicrobia bacterium]|nr:hypothetical protein [Elusimicrobiota bacterium]